MRLVYLLLSAVGLVGTWFFNLRSRASGQGYLAGWFANDASSSAVVDLIVVAVVAWTFPLFLAWREHHLRKQQHSGATSVTSARVPA